MIFSRTERPRPLLPFGRISPAAKLGWPVTGPAFWVCRAKSRGISLRETTLCGCPLRGHGFATSAPLFCCSRRGCAAPGPQRQTPVFFGYFLNIKKVTPSADFVISPAKAGALRFSHTRLPLSPGPCSRSVAFHLRRNRASGHRPRLLGLPRKIARGISLRETTLCGCPLRGHGFATPHRYFAVPVTAAPRRVPNGKTRPLLPFGRISPAAKPGWPVIGPTADVLPFPSRLRRAGAPTAKPGPAPVRSHFACGETGLAGHRSH